MEDVCVKVAGEDEIGQTARVDQGSQKVTKISDLDGKD